MSIGITPIARPKTKLRLNQKTESRIKAGLFRPAPMNLEWRNEWSERTSDSLPSASMPKSGAREKTMKAAVKEYFEMKTASMSGLSAEPSALVDSKKPKVRPKCALPDDRRA